MYQIDFSHPVSVHFIGIGGISMSGLAQVLLERGFTVSGSDSAQSALTQALAEKGARIFYGQKADNVSSRPDLVVYTAAIHPDNPEYAAAISLGIPTLTRAQLLGQMMKNYRHAVAVAGTHGKTTTTSMLAQIFMEGNLDPTVSVGGILPSIGGNIRVGKSDLFLTEACEYTDSFLSFFPTIGIILNMDADHLDYFDGIEHIRRSFASFAALLPSDGALIINTDTPCWEQAASGLSCRVITFGIDNPADYTAENVSVDQYGHSGFSVLKGGRKIMDVCLKVPGIHNVSNALAAVAAAELLGIPADVIVRGLGSFSGAERRFEYKGQTGGVTIIDDYAHHPTEISATLSAAKDYPHKKLWCVFQPHTYSRTKALLEEFADALSAADHVVLADIYAAREKDDGSVSSEDLRNKIAAKGTPCEYFPSFEEIESWLLSQCASGDLILTMGAGSIFKVGEDLLGK